jgi:hypothetical protein
MPSLHVKMPVKVSTVHTMIPFSLIAAQTFLPFPMEAWEDEKGPQENKAE